MLVRKLQINVYMYIHTLQFIFLLIFRIFLDFYCELLMYI